MTRILRLLLIAAIALPLCQPVAAQDAVLQISESDNVTLLKESLENASLCVDVAKPNANQSSQRSQTPKRDVSVRSHTETSDLPVCDGTATNKYFPIYGWYYDNYAAGSYTSRRTRSQMIYTETELAGLVEGCSINSLTFHASGGIKFSTTSGDGVLTITLGNCTQSAFTSNSFASFSGTTVTGTVTPKNNSTEFTVTFSTPFVYNGGNLLVDVTVTTAGTCDSSSGATVFDGISTNNSQSLYYYYHSNYNDQYGYTENFLPKMTINYTAIVHDPYEATFEGNGDFGSVVINQTGRATFTVTNTGTEPFTPVVAVTGDQEFSVRTTGYGELESGKSRYYEVKFAPTALGDYNGTITLTARESEAAAINASATLSGTCIESKQQEVGEGTTEGIVPVYLWYLETANHGQIIYPADDLNLPKGAKIKKITFHANANLESNSGGSSSPVTIKIGESDQSTYSSTTFLGTTGFTSTTVNNIFTGEQTVDFEFSTPYEYQGGNLVVDASCTNGGAYGKSGVTWHGVTKTGASLLARSSSSSASTLGTPSQTNYLPYITIDWIPKEIEARDITVLTAEDFESKTYTWEEDGETKEANLTEIATTPKQMIAMLTKIYTDPTIPGNLKRGFDENGNDEAYNDCHYTGVGTINRSGGYNNASYYSFNPSRGWDIPGDLEYKSASVGSGTAYFAYMDSTQYRPNEEGLTLILVEIKDDFDKSDLYDADGNAIYDRTNLEAWFANTLKSARVITEARRTGEGLDAGTLFKIDCDKMNKFFLLAKGQLCWKNNSYYATTTHQKADGTYYTLGNPFWATPATIFYQYTSTNDGNTYYVNRFCDYYSQPLFYHMFEEFSPNAFGEDAKNDLYSLMVSDDMTSFGVVHDCASVEPIQGHGFMMYDVQSGAADCQDVRDMMFFIPDYRMMKDATRDNHAKYYKFSYYNTLHQPMMGMYVIRQDEITPTTAADEYYMLNLNWRTNLDDYLPSQDQEFELLEVVVDENTGVEKYVPVYYMNEQGKYTDAAGQVLTDQSNPVPIVLTMSPGREKNYPSVYVKREVASKQVTYAIRGRDAANAQGKHFLSLQISNKMSYIVPGTDATELVLLKDATHYSRFDAERVRNAYSNKIVMNNNVDGIKQADITSGTQMTITRVAQVPAGSTAGVTTDPVTVATVTFNPSAQNYTVQMANQAADATEFPECADHSRAGYHANNADKTGVEAVVGNGSWTNDYEVNANGTINLGSLVIFDNFVQEIPVDNSHPFGYIYNVTTNYPCPPTSVYLNVSSLQGNDAVDWWAFTWTGSVSKWVKGVKLEEGLFKFSPVKDKIIFARVEKDQEPDASFNHVYNQTYDLTAQLGKTCYLTHYNNDNKLVGDYDNPWSLETTDEMAHSNSFRIPIYKTSSQINGSFTQAEVDGDSGGTLGLPENVEFGVGVQLSSKTEVLRYDTYRWNEGAPRYSVQSANGDDEQDIAPTGQAMNQGEYYTITMNGDTDDETNGEVTVSTGSGTATFVDKVPAGSDAAGAYIYAPIVEAFSGRGDYNTYGGNLQSSASGRFNGQRDTSEPPMSSYYWEADGKRYAYYNIQFSVDRNIKMVPDGYDIYKIRVWRKIDDKSLLKEEYADQSAQIAARMGDENGTYMYEISYDEEDGQVMYNFKNGASLGSVDMKELTADVTGVNGSSSTITYSLGTFGAQKLRTDETEAADLDKVIEQLDLTYVVRLYFTRSANLTATRGAAEGADGKYYIVEQEIPVTLNGGIPTAVENLSAREVVGVKYYNVAGIESDTPFQGVNIVVTHYSDGSTTTTKILK